MDSFVNDCWVALELVDSPTGHDKYIGVVAYIGVMSGAIVEAIEHRAHLALIGGRLRLQVDAEMFLVGWHVAG